MQWRDAYGLRRPASGSRVPLSRVRAQGAQSAAARDETTLRRPTRPPSMSALVAAVGADDRAAVAADLEAATAADPAVRPGLAAGDFAPLLGWLRANVHAKGSSLGTDEIMAEATGRPLGIDSYLAHLRRRYLGEGAAA